MKKRLLIFGILLTLLLAAGVALVVGANAGLNTDVARRQVALFLQEQVGVPVTFEQCHFTLSGKLEITGVSATLPPPKRKGEAEKGASNGVANGATSGVAKEVASGAKPPECSSLSVPAVSASLAFRPLLKGRIELKRLAFEEPEIVWVAGSKFKIPRKKKAKTPEEKAAAKKDELTVGSKKYPVNFALRTVQMNRATITFVSGKEANRVALEDVRLASRIVDAVVSGTAAATATGSTSGSAASAPEKIVGELAVRRATLNERGEAHKIAGQFEFDGETVTLKPLTLQLSEGNVEVEASLNLEPNERLASPFTAKAKLQSLNIKKLQESFVKTPGPQKIAGLLDATAQVSGRFGEMATYTGNAHATLRNGQMEQVPILQTIGKTLSIEELGHLKLKGTQADVRIANEKVLVDRLWLESVNIGVEASGTVGFDGRLNLSTKLVVAPAITRHFPKWAEAAFKPASGNGRLQIGFSITGTTSNPECNLMDLILGQKYGGQVRGLWDSLRGKKKGKPKPATTAAPAPGTDEDDED